MFLIITLIFVSTAQRIVAANTFITNWFDQMNQELADIQQDMTAWTWRFEIGTQSEPDHRNRPDDSLAETRRKRAVSDVVTGWREEKCAEALRFPSEALDDRYKRMVYLLCRGPRFTESSKQISGKMKTELLKLYESTKVCLREHGCLKSEPELDLLMRENRDPEMRLAAWQGIRDALGPRSISNYRILITQENRAARAAGYSDIGECWREELETPNLIQVVEDLFDQVAPLYKLLHAFVRYRLSQYYGERLVPPGEPIPAHLIGNMCSSIWDGMMDIISDVDLGLDAAIRRLFPTAKAMVKSAEDYYASLGLPRMTKQFWENSYYSFENKSRPAMCHGSSANMYKPGDKRMLLCTQINWEDFYVIHHEMGHIQYYMAYDKQPMIFQEGANSAVQETIGDAVMLAVRSAKNLQRKGILTNTTEKTEMTLMLLLALNKIPQLSYGLILDKWRWDIMASKVDVGSYNDLWWKYRYEYQGVQPPVPRYRNSMDPMSKFHVPDHTPYIRYYLSGFLQFQFLDVMCTDVLNEGQPLHECDLYGNKAAGRKLMSLMEKGMEKPWDETLQEFSNGKYSTVSAEPLLRYFSPLKGYLEEQLENQGISIGW